MNNTITYEEFLELVIEEVNNRIDGNAKLETREFGLTTKYDILTSFNNAWVKICIDCSFGSKIWDMYVFYLDNKTRKTDYIDRCVGDILSVLKQEIIKYLFKVSY